MDTAWKAWGRVSCSWILRAISWQWVCQEYSFITANSHQKSQKILPLQIEVRPKSSTRPGNKTSFDPLSSQGIEIKPPGLPDKPKYESAHVETFDPRGQQMLKRNLIHSPNPPTHRLPKPGQDIPLWRDEDFTADVGRWIFRAAQGPVHQALVLPGGFQGCPQPTSPP